MHHSSWASTHHALFITLIVLAAVWSLPWKLVALWKSARNGHLIWFIIMSFINTLAILEIIYIFAVDDGKKRR